MDKNNYAYVIMGVVLLLVIVTMLPKYFTGNVTASEDINYSEVEKIEIYHFHGTNQCSSCIAVGDLAEETINAYFSDELKSGKIIFDHINGDLAENGELVKKYEATGSSLWIGVYYKDGTFTKEENVNVWYKINNKKDYVDYLKGVIKGKFLGD